MSKPDGGTRGVLPRPARCLLSAFAAIFWAQVLIAQSPAPLPAARDKVCLVLEGGGALGLAHVGVLLELEARHIPIDCIAGTSMGAIIGGLYAAGYSAAELETLVLGLDWPTLLRDRPDRRRIPFRRKVDDLDYLTRWELGVSRHGLKTPIGLTAGHRLGVELRILALRALGVTDFDALPIPFRATATDIVTGELVVLDHGDLATALRASMAVPGLFAPVEIDGRLLVDGGVAANLPVAEARALGSDFVIAVDLGQPLAEGHRPSSMIGVLGRTAGFVSRVGVERSLQDVDLLIRPQLQEFTFLDFSRPAALIARGREAAVANSAALSALALDDEAWREHLSERQRRLPAQPALVVGAVETSPERALPSSVAGRAIRTRPGTVLDTALLRADLERLWNLGEFSAVDFSLTPRANDDWTLRFEGRPPALGNNVARFGLSVVSDLEGTNSLEALTVVTMSRLNRMDGELKLKLEAGESPLVGAELYQPFLPSRIPFLAVGAKGALAKYQLDVGDRSVQYRARQGVASLDLGASLGRYGEVRIGVREFERRDSASGDRPPGAPKFERNDAGDRIAIVIDQLESVNFPRHGFLAVGEYYRALPSLGADLRYKRLDLGTLVAVSHGRQTLVGRIHATSAVGGLLPVEDALELGGLFDLSGTPRGEIRGNYGGVATLIYLYRLGRLPNFGDGIYAAISFETGNAWTTSSAVSMNDLRRAMALSLGVDTWLGPVYLGWGKTQHGKDSFYLYVGRTF